jgi:hypothetical protein
MLLCKIFVSIHGSHVWAHAAGAPGHRHTDSSSSCSLRQVLTRFSCSSHEPGTWRPDADCGSPLHGHFPYSDQTSYIIHMFLSDIHIPTCYTDAKVRLRSEGPPHHQDLERREDDAGLDNRHLASAAICGRSACLASRRLRFLRHPSGQGRHHDQTLDALDKRLVGILHGRPHHRVTTTRPRQASTPPVNGTR